MSKSERRVRPVRRNQIESLEDRLAMSADPLPGFFDGAIGHHGLQEEPMQVAPHAAADPTAADQAPALTHHALQQHVPPVSQHGDANTIPPLSHQTEQLPDFWLDPVSEQINTIEDMLGEVEQTLSSAHGKTGLNDVRANYGFRGGGQTVAVIDSGIAYDHYALGGGFGSNYRVVGGWDFTAENDADPYDDGPEGSHGTHVAGIIGSSDNTHQGVAPDVDLVGLRVFDDHGAGYFSWVEDALQWVYANRDAFENPITAVNLSLGTNWNSETVPSWAMLENEFAQLESVGIFISVSAGNSFTSYN
ncbi:MAG: S8 family serine peptidase, partial [Planctomycetota bacterium]